MYQSNDSKFLSKLTYGDALVLLMHVYSVRNGFSSVLFPSKSYHHTNIRSINRCHCPLRVIIIVILWYGSLAHDSPKVGKEGEKTTYKCGELVFVLKCIVCVCVFVCNAMLKGKKVYSNLKTESCVLLQKTVFSFRRIFNRDGSTRFVGSAGT